jgi:NAD(P) transhydrogenase subunit beta
MFANIINFLYLVSAVLFMLGIKYLSSPVTAKKGNMLSAVGMALAILVTLLNPAIGSYTLIVLGVLIGTAVGVVAAIKVKMTQMPEMVAVFNGCGGIASALVALAEFQGHKGAFAPFTLTTLLLSMIVGSLTFSGSMMAFAKLQALISTRPITYRGQQIGNGLVVVVIVILSMTVFLNTHNLTALSLLIVLSLALGVFSVIPIGGADMPVVISLLNSYSGVAVAMTGLALENNALIIVGSLVGASGLFLTKIMCSAMNRSLANVLFSAFGTVTESFEKSEVPTGVMKGCEVEDVAMVLANADSVIVVPGYGMAAAQAQHTVRDLTDYLISMGINVRYAIHSVAGRMPGHMNVLLAEADVSYDLLHATEDINDDFSSTDVALIIGANDVVNPAAKNNPGSPIYGMPILNADKAKTVIVLKRSMNVGFAGIKNELFYLDNTMMFFGDAKASVQNLLSELKKQA